MENTVLIPHGELNILCRLSEPDDGWIRRVVLGVHGLGGSSNDDIQRNIAEEMALFHGATFRFDFPGHGENPLDTLSVDSCVQTLLAVARTAKARYPQVEDLCIFATGFGAYITLIALPQLQQLPGRLKLVVQTPNVLMHDTLLAMINISRETFRVMEKVTFPLKRPLDVTYAFYEELRQHIALTTYTTPMLILHGEDDDYIRMSDIQQFRRINEKSKLVIIPGASHRFLEYGAWDMVLDLTRDWFEFEQVLLADWE